MPMHVIDTEMDPVQYPQTSITGGAEKHMLDSGWDVNWPGPAHIYFTEGDLVDIVVPALVFDGVQAALHTNGWVSPETVAEQLAAKQEKIDELTDALSVAEAAQVGFEKALERLEAKTHKAPAKKPVAKK